MNSDTVRDLVRQFTAGDLSRRDFMVRAAALGLSASAIGSFLDAGRTPVAAQDDPLTSWPPPAYIPEPESEILMPIEAPLTEETVSFRVVMSESPFVTDFADNRLTQWLEVKTNVHIDWQMVPDEDALTRLNLMLTSGDIPDIILGLVGRSQMMVYGQQGIILPLNDLIAEHAPRVQKVFAHYPVARDTVTGSDGNIYAMPSVEECFQCSMSKRLWIYQPWLDALGLDMPQTTDELEQVLLAFKEQDPNGNGLADEIPLSGTMSYDAWYSHLDFFFMNSFIYNPGQWNSSGPWLILKDGRVTPIYNTPEWKAGLEYLHRLYEQGLIDPQFFSQDIDGLQRLGNNPDVAILGAVPSGWWPDFVATGGEADPRWLDYVTVPPLAGPEGVRYAAWEAPWTDPAAVITSACKDPALAVRWLDTFYWQEATLRMDNGVLGENWRWAEEGEVSLTGQQAVHTPLGVPSVGPSNVDWAGLGPMYVTGYLADAQAVDPETADTDIGALLYRETKQNYEPYRQPSELDIPPLHLTQEQSDAIADPETTITQYVIQMFTAFVRGDSDIDAGWEQYLDTLDQMGLANYLQVYQDAYDAKYGG